MPGAKGRSGGARPNSGPKPNSTTYRQDEQVAVWERFNDKPVGLGQAGKIKIINRNQMEIYLEDGTTYFIMRG